MPRPTNMKTKTRFGALICNQLSKMGKNQKDLAQESGLSPFYVSEILNGKHNPSVRAVYNISKAIGISIEELTKALLDEN